MHESKKRHLALALKRIWHIGERKKDLDRTGACWSRGQPPHHSEVQVWQKSWSVWWQAVNGPNRAEGPSSLKFCILTLSFS